MSRTNIPILSESARLSLENAYDTHPKSSYRKRCQMILLKAQGRTSKDVGSIVGCSDVTVNSWLKRYKLGGLSGLQIKSGRGRPPLIDVQLDKEEVLSLVKKHRQRVSLARTEWSSSSGKSVSERTFRRFLKSVVDDING